ncbi:hypothetical protein GCM10022223_51220 [Kineosporia mesophila]|uniref:Uncharacterized protein n=1 Tax=Kineosporia mesophila TaxID=566012 RepID=A0ABP7A9T2_9ACTN|nr:hypothetical protein [Kineosporia mesophila]MCD5354690.1 hypothetical protein [Kineosporia mesophila]
MDEIGILDGCGLVLVAGCLVAMVIAVVRIYRDLMDQAEKRRAAGISPDRPKGVAQKNIMVDVLEHPDNVDLTEQHLVELRLNAMALRSTRALVVVQAAMVVAWWGNFLVNRWLWAGIFAAFMTLLFLPVWIQVERNARIGAAFLRRFPA